VGVERRSAERLFLRRFLVPIFLRCVYVLRLGEPQQLRRDPPRFRIREALLQTEAVLTEIQNRL
jgi:hypothetical protein